MNIQQFRRYSPALDREMDITLYGHAGRPALFIPCQDGRHFDFRNFRMTDYWSPWIDAGKVMVFSIDTIDKETWSDTDGDPVARIERHEQWVRFITDEVVPFIRELTNQYNSSTGNPGVLVFGCSLGATHALNLYLRRPDLFDRVLALSGIYTADYGFGSFRNEAVYMNSPVEYMANMPADHPYVEMLNRNKGVVCVGRGPWEIPDSTEQLARIFAEKGIHLWVDFWGYDCAHDWDWWYRQVTYFLPYLLDEQ